MPLPQETNPMTNASLFEHVMRALWGDTEANSDFVVKCIADKIRGTQRVNPENAFDVLDMFGPDYLVWIDSRGSDTEEPDVTVHTIRFTDGSSILVEARRGQGCGVEVIS